jgi:hypothetical protein
MADAGAAVARREATPVSVAAAVTARTRLIARTFFSFPSMDDAGKERATRRDDTA